MISLRTRGERPYGFAAWQMSRGTGAPKPAVLLPEHLNAAVILAVLQAVIALVASCHVCPPFDAIHTDFNGINVALSSAFPVKRKNRGEN